MAGEFKSRTLTDSFFAFDRGMHSGIAPLLLPKNQLSFAVNATVRGAFLTHRPPYNQLTPTFIPRTVIHGYPSYPQFSETIDIEPEFKNGIWQGGCYYKPDYGPESLVCQISGRLYQIIIQGNTATVKDVTVANDANDPTAPQAWLWQAERWVICNNGLALPVFFDGESSRRSMGVERQIGPVIGGPFAVPPIGGFAVVNLAQPYTGPLNVPLDIYDLPSGRMSRYQIVGTPTPYQITLQNKSANVGDTIPTGEQIISDPKFTGLTIGDVVWNALTETVRLNQPFSGTVGSSITISTPTFTLNGTVTAISANPPLYRINVKLASIPNVTVPSGTPCYNSSISLPVTVIGITSSPFIVPAIGSSVDVFVDRSFGGNTAVWIGDPSQAFQASPGPPTPAAPLTTVYLKNINDPGPTNTGTLVFTLPELGAGRAGAYGRGRVWECLVDGHSFIGGDTLRGASGVPNFDFRDAVLRVQENTFLANGGAFSVPFTGGDIRAMLFTVMPDTSLGQGPLLVVTPTRIHSCNSPVNRADWITIENPILTDAVIANGGLGFYNTFLANGDVIYRAVDGIRSFIMARRDFNTWGTAPISYEMNRILPKDEQSLLPFGFGTIFDNRSLMSAGPTATSQGVYHQGMAVANFDTISSLGGKSPPVYDSLWLDLNAFEVMTGQFAGVERSFAVCYDRELQVLTLKEILTDQGGFWDNNDPNNPILWSAETAILDFGQRDPATRNFKRLDNGEIYVDEMVGVVDFSVFYKPDQYPCWVEWFSWSECAEEDPDGKFQFRPEMGLGTPSPSNCDPATNRPLREGWTFQIKIVVRGHCRIVGARFEAVTIPNPKYAKMGCEGLCIDQEVAI